MKKVSVIIPAYNSEAFVGESVESALNQTYPSLEVIVVNDGSTDSTEDALSPFMDRIVYIKKENGGPASARNVGIKRSTGDYICFLDADDKYLPEKVEKQVTYLNDHPNVGLVFSDASILGGGFLAQRGSIHEALPIYQGYVFPRLFISNFILNLTVMIRREVLDKSGLFDEDRKFISIEDYELWLRIAMHYPVGYISERLANYRVHSSNISSNLEASIKKNFFIAEKFEREFPKLEKKYPKLFKKKRAYTFCRLGTHFFKRYDFEGAKRSFFEAMKCREYLRQAFLGYVASSFRLPILHDLSKISIDFFLKGSSFFIEGKNSIARNSYINAMIAFPLYYRSYIFFFYTLFGDHFRGKFTIGEDQ